MITVSAQKTIVATVQPAAILHADFEGLRHVEIPDDGVHFLEVTEDRYLVVDLDDEIWVGVVTHLASYGLTLGDYPWAEEAAEFGDGFGDRYILLED